MRDFFHGWRRKLGCVTLLMAAALMMAWMRSLLVEDLILETGPEMTYYTSHHGLLQWDQITHTAGRPVTWDKTRRWEILALHNHDAVTRPIRESVLVWQRPGFGFSPAVAEYYDSSGIPCRREQRIIPYWSLIVPLTLLSAYLFLRGP